MVKERYKQMMRSSSLDVMEDYSAEREERPLLVVQTGTIEGSSLLLYANLPHNFEKKYEEYIKALASNKRIVII